MEGRGSPCAARASSVSGEGEGAADDARHDLRVPPHVPAQVGGQGGGHFRNPHARALVAVGVHRGHQNRIFVRLVFQRWLAGDDPLGEARPAVNVMEHVRFGADEGRHCREVIPVGAAGDQPAVGPRRDAALGGRAAAGDPLVQGAQQGTENGVGRQRIQRVSRHPAFEGGGRVVVLQRGEQVDADVLVLREVIAAGVGVHQRAAPLPVFGGGLGVDDAGDRFPGVSGPSPAFR